MITSIIKRNWTMYKRYFPILLFFNRIVDSILEFLGFWLLANYLFNNSIITSQTAIDDYFTYASIGLLFYNLSVATLMNVGRSLMIEGREGTLESLLIAPVKIEYYYIGIFIEQLIRSFLEFIISFLFAILFGAKLLDIPLHIWFVFYIYVSFVSFCMSVCLSNVMLYLRDTFITQNTVFITIFLISGITFPKEILPRLIQLLGNLIPLTQTVDLFRNLYSEVKPSFIDNLAFYSSILSSLFYFYLGIYLYKKIEQKIVSYI
ncbi:TPA: ABC transporter permease [Streptococcus agalactiae]|nr:MAG: ABC transporter permease [Streptococcus sp.]